MKTWISSVKKIKFYQNALKQKIRVKNHQNKKIRKIKKDIFQVLHLKYTPSVHTVPPNALHLKYMSLSLDEHIVLICGGCIHLE